MAARGDAGSPGGRSAPEFHPGFLRDGEERRADGLEFGGGFLVDLDFAAGGGGFDGEGAGEAQFVFHEGAVADPEAKRAGGFQRGEFVLAGWTRRSLAPVSERVPVMTSSSARMSV